MTTLFQIIMQPLFNLSMESWSGYVACNFSKCSAAVMPCELRLLGAVNIWEIFVRQRYVQFAYEYFRTDLVVVVAQM